MGNGLYEYEQEREKLFNPDGVKLLFAIRDQARDLIEKAGVFTDGAGINLPDGMGAADTFEMTLRDWYAGQASKAFLQECDDGTDIDYERAAEMVFKMAGAMIAEGKKAAGWTLRELKMLNALKAVKNGYKDPATLDGATCLEIVEEAIDEAEGEMRA